MSSRESDASSAASGASAGTARNHFKAPVQFESEPSDVWRDDYGRGGPVRSSEPERDWFFEQSAAAEISGDAATESATESGQRSSVLRALRRPGTFSGRLPKGYRPTDERIQELVCERVTEDPAIDASDVSVVVECAIVKASGTVATQSMKQALIRAMSGVHGVIGIVDTVRVASSSS